MKTNTSKPNQLKKLEVFFGKIDTTIASGLPSKKVLIKPANENVLQTWKDRFKPDSEKHYHLPIAKPTVEKQTLLEEMKKPKTKH